MMLDPLQAIAGHVHEAHELSDLRHWLVTRAGEALERRTVNRRLKLRAAKRPLNVALWVTCARS
jgi:hypothetical protein